MVGGDPQPLGWKGWNTTQPAAPDEKVEAEDASGGGSVSGLYPGAEEGLIELALGDARVLGAALWYAPSRACRPRSAATAAAARRR